MKITNSEGKKNLAGVDIHMAGQKFFYFLHNRIGQLPDKKRSHSTHIAIVLLHRGAFLVGSQEPIRIGCTCLDRTTDCIGAVILSQ